jgi:hypothetical protein
VPHRRLDRLAEKNWLCVVFEQGCKVSRVGLILCFMGLILCAMIGEKK